MAETAGLVLAAFPAIVQALSSFAKSLETAKSWRYYRRELKSYARMLDCQRTWYSDTLEELFDGIVTTDDELAQLMSHPDGPSWKLHEDQLRFRLGTAYMSYLNTIEELMAALQDFSQRIGIDESGKVRSGGSLFRIFSVPWSIIISCQISAYTDSSYLLNRRVP